MSSGYRYEPTPDRPGVVGLAVVGCGTSSASNKAAAGEVCKVDEECASASCLDFGLSLADGGCSLTLRSCSKSCSVDADCASLGPKFKCFIGCGGAHSCGGVP